MSSHKLPVSRTAYDSIAVSYDQATHGTATRQFANLTSAICQHRFSQLQGLRFLDLGCGTGILAKILVDAGAAVVGVDRSWAMLRMAGLRVPGRLVCGDALHLPLRGCFDVVTACNEVVNQWDGEKLGQVIRNIRARLQPRGILVFDAVTLEHFARFWDGRHWQEGRDGTQLWMDCEWRPGCNEGRARLLSFRATAGRCRIESSLLTQHWHSTVRLEALLKEAGFTLLETMPFTPLPEPQPEGFMDRVLYVAAVVQ